MKSCSDNTSIPIALDLGSEWLCAVISSFLVAPVISIVDKSIISNAAGTKSLGPALIDGFKSLLQPAKFIRQPSFLMIWGVYAGTYIVGNSIDCLSTRNQKDPFYPKFIGSSVANVGLSVAKDRSFARMFGKGSPRALPLPSYVFFASRDSLTILAGFSLPPVVSKSLQSSNMSQSTADIVSQLSVPCIMQFFSTPLHLLGLDLYNRTDRTISISQRMNFIVKEYLKTSLARIARIFPAYGIGGVVNKKLRKETHKLFKK